MDRHNCPRLWSDCGGDGFRVDVWVRRKTVGKHELRAAAYEGVCDSDVRERRQYDFITFMQITQQGGHLHRRRARGCQKNFSKSELLLECLLAALCESAIAGEVPGPYG